MTRKRRAGVDREDAFGALVEEYTSGGGLVLALGAGVSTGCDIPTWKGLLKRIATRAFDPDDGEICDRLIDGGYTLPAIASILAAKFSAPGEFLEIIREALYSSFEFYPRGVRGRDQARFVQFVAHCNPTLRAVAALCAVTSGKRSGFAPNPRIHAVVNFNLDATLRVYSYHRHDKHLLRTVERPSAGARPRRLSVYHMHGFLQFDERRARDPRAEADITVLTEQEYFDFFHQPMGMYNYTFLHALREFSCLFIGMSLRDDNIRRLLHHSKKERVDSDRREGKSAAEAEARSRRHFAILPREADRRLNELSEVSLGRLGVSVIWVDDFAEIPVRLSAMYEAAGQSWNEVF